MKVCSRNIHHLPKHSVDFQNLYLINGNPSRHKRRDSSDGNILIAQKMVWPLSFFPMLWLLYLLRTNYQEINFKFKITVHSLSITAKPSHQPSHCSPARPIELSLPVPFFLCSQIHTFFPKTCLALFPTSVKSSRRIDSIFLSKGPLFSSNTFFSSKKKEKTPQDVDKDVEGIRIKKRICFLLHFLVLLSLRLVSFPARLQSTK